MRLPSFETLTEALELERTVWQHWQITRVVNKASGTPRGEPIKLSHPFVRSTGFDISLPPD
ncbi:hypothetical protein [Laspinema palackyanum]|uniref:hypothetical protein n=1 Tax=Laspinema palackyanum TaxID=3231601 RepID=UPI00345D28C1|nr:hypothetical protein [Laspinema sp. D2c]